MKAIASIEGEGSSVHQIDFVPAVLVQHARRLP
jgi:hypothetical protein